MRGRGLCWQGLVEIPSATRLRAGQVVNPSWGRPRSGGYDEDSPLWGVEADEAPERTWI